MIAIVEQADVPTTADGLQELQQRPGTFRKFEPQQAFVLEPRCNTADQVPDMQFRQLVVA